MPGTSLSQINKLGNPRSARTLLCRHGVVKGVFWRFLIVVSRAPVKGSRRRTFYNQPCKREGREPSVREACCQYRLLY